MMFSSKFACSARGYSIPELSHEFSHSASPFGACPTQTVSECISADPDRLIVDPELSLSSGAIKGWDRRSMYYYHLLKCLARHYGTSLDSEWQDLSVEIQNKVLYGSGNESIDFSYVSDRGREVQKNHPFEGVIRNLERR